MSDLPMTLPPLGVMLAQYAAECRAEDERRDAEHLDAIIGAGDCGAVVEALGPPVWRLVTCPVCRGTGSVAAENGHKYGCLACDGYGEIMRETRP